MKMTEEIKVRVEPLAKHSLEQMARAEQLQLSDMVRRAIREYIAKRQPAVANQYGNT